MTKCAYCKYNDGAVYTSNPPKYRCTVTGEYHLALDDCNVEFAPVKHGRWESFDLTWGRSIYACTSCGEAFEVPTENGKPMYDYCPNCGARMDGGENG